MKKMVLCFFVSFLFTNSAMAKGNLVGCTMMLGGSGAAMGTFGGILTGSYEGYLAAREDVENSEYKNNAISSLMLGAEILLLSPAYAIVRAIKYGVISGAGSTVAGGVLCLVALSN